MCAGCHKPTDSRTEGHRCHFYGCGFKVAGMVFSGCGVAYHEGCISVGDPFRTRKRKGAGLSYPGGLRRHPFVCELCTVRANLGRELHMDQSDLSLLALERMRLIDAAHAWTPDTLDDYRRNIDRLHRFASDFDVPLDLSASIPHPPVGHVIPMLWAMEHYVLQASTRSPTGYITFNTARAIRSAMSSYDTWIAAQQMPGLSYRGERRRTHIGDRVLPTDALAASLTTAGMARRLGTAVKPSISLLQRHVLWNQRYRADEYATCAPDDLQGRYTWAAANVAEAMAWLGWLRASEVFSVEWGDVSETHPSDHALHDFPPGAGAVFLRLLESTKSDQTKQADVVIAYESSAGIQLGFWLQELRHLSSQLGWTSGPIFRHSDGTPWDSHYFRHNQLYPLLTLQRIGGDPFLKAFDGSPGNTIAAKFYSMHSYRNGGRSSVSKRRPGCVRAATPVEVTEHGRWRQRHSGREPLPLHYLQRTLEDRLYITLLCM